MRISVPDRILKRANAYSVAIGEKNINMFICKAIVAFETILDGTMTEKERELLKIMLELNDEKNA